jgi:DNA-binding protein HU-beta
MNKTELVAAIAENAGIKKVDAEKALNAFIAVVQDELVKGGDIRLVGFGTFDVKERAAHQGINPASGEKIEIAASKAPRFKAGKALKDAVNA